MSMRPTDEQVRQMHEKEHEKRITETMKTEDMIREIHGWLSEIMPAARAAAKMMDARASLVKRWRGGKGQ